MSQRIENFMVTAQFKTPDGARCKLGFPLLTVHELDDVEEVFRQRLPHYDFETCAPPDVTAESFDRVLNWVPMITERIDA